MIDGLRPVDGGEGRVLVHEFNGFDGDFTIHLWMKGERKSISELCE
jgi:hypothetical protein